jgi:hypothetical protein
LFFGWHAVCFYLSRALVFGYLIKGSCPFYPTYYQPNGGDYEPE